MLKIMTFLSSFQKNGKLSIILLVEQVASRWIKPENSLISGKNWVGKSPFSIEFYQNVDEQMPTQPTHVLMPCKTISFLKLFKNENTLQMKIAKLQTN